MGRKIPFTLLTNFFAVRFIFSETVLAGSSGRSTGLKSLLPLGSKILLELVFTTLPAASSLFISL